MKKNHKKIALVYDWLDTNFGGAEIVIQNLLKIYPEATLFTAFIDKKKCSWAKKYQIKTSFLQKFPWIYRHKTLASLFLPLAFESFDLSEFKTVISISSFAAKYVLTKPEQTHYAYILTPPRFLFSHKNDYQNKLFKFFPFNLIYKKIFNYLKKVDLIAVNRADKLIAISQIVQSRIKKIYKKDSFVIYPPVDLVTRDLLIKKSSDNFKTKTNYLLNKLSLEGYYLVVSRLVYYKRVDLAIKAIAKLRKNLVIVGSSGGQKSRLFKLCLKLGLKKQVSIEQNLEVTKFSNEFSQVVFLRNLEKKEILALMKRAQGFLLIGLEDFGIAALEASLVGCPLISHQQSGVYELISSDEKVGFNKVNLENLIEAIKESSFNNKANFTESNQVVLTEINQELLFKFENAWKNLVDSNSN
jgi:glycosyltransferase involved in cell wall biosynthesis